MNAVFNAANQMMAGVTNAVLGIQNGALQITLDRLSYVGGDTVSGMVHLQCFMPFQARGVVVTIRGYETVGFEEERQERDPNVREGEPERRIRKVYTHEDTHTFFSTDVRVYDQQGVVAVGNYSFPFHYRLPDALPGTYAETSQAQIGTGAWYRAEILYVASARFDVAYQSNLRADVRLVVNEKFDRAVAPSYATNQKSFLLTKGRLVAKVWLDHNCYFPGNAVIAKLEANNTSTKSVQLLTVHIRKHLQLRAGGFDGRSQPQRKSLHADLYKRTYHGLPPSFYGVRFLPFDVPLAMMPTTKTSARIQCTYSLVLTLSVPGAIDLNVDMPLTVLAPQFLFAPPEHAPTGVPPAPAVPADVSFRPPWQADSEAPRCSVCGAGFSLLNRRHHCRHCGKVVCGKCANKKLPLPNLGYAEPVLVCAPCLGDAAAGGRRFMEAPAEWQSATGGVEIDWQPPPPPSAPPSSQGDLPDVVAYPDIQQQQQQQPMTMPPQQQQQDSSYTASFSVQASAPPAADVGFSIDATNATTFATLKTQLQAEMFGDAKLATLRAAAASNTFSGEQALELVRDCFSFGGDRVEAAKVLHPRVVDGQFFRVYEAFDFSSDKERLQKELGL